MGSRYNRETIKSDDSFVAHRQRFRALAASIGNKYLQPIYFITYTHMTECKMASSASWKRKHGGDQNNTSSQLVPPPDPSVCQRQTDVCVCVIAIAPSLTNTSVRRKAHPNTHHQSAIKQTLEHTPVSQQTQFKGRIQLVRGTA